MTPKSNRSLVRELLQALAKVTSAVSSGVVGNPINPGPVVDPKTHRPTTPPRRR
ncbi:hypothetical protein AB0O34_17805 [Sphaerisporangium sp. NPDC088356]|uniref:hypothetical protein n=1 Tax=Sphaerisporangium sp. NPDC088356 TaxID=3154871 RepID=UPI00342F57D7